MVVVLATLVNHQTQPKSYVDRDNAILNLARGKLVLHLGCVGNTQLSPSERVHLAKSSLHWKLTAESQVVGVDYSVEVIEEYRRLGIFHNIIAGDVQSLNQVGLKGPFEVVVAADIIEHVSNPGDLLDGLKPYCTRESKVIITTPHAFGLPNVIRFFAGNFKDGDEHVMTFNCDNITNLLRRHGFTVETLNTCFQALASSRRILFPLGRRVFNAIPKLGGTIFVVARVAR